MNETVLKAKELDQFNNNLPEVDINDIVTLKNVWDGNGENPIELGSYSYQITDMDWINYQFNVVKEDKENPLNSILKILEIELL